MQHQSSLFGEQDVLTIFIKVSVDVHRLIKQKNL